MIGRVVQIIGPVVDVTQGEEALGKLRIGQSVEVDQVVCEVQQLMGDGISRTVAMSGTDGLRRGQEVTVRRDPISVPVGKCTLGRIFNVLGETVDDAGEVLAYHRRGYIVSRQCTRTLNKNNFETKNKNGLI